MAAARVPAEMLHGADRRNNRDRVGPIFRLRSIRTGPGLRPGGGSRSGPSLPALPPEREGIVPNVRGVLLRGSFSLGHGRFPAEASRFHPPGGYSSPVRRGQPSPVWETVGCGKTEPRVGAGLRATRPGGAATPARRKPTHRPDKPAWIKGHSSHRRLPKHRTRAVPAAFGRPVGCHLGRAGLEELPFLLARDAT